MAIFHGKGFKGGKKHQRNGKSVKFQQQGSRFHSSRLQDDIEVIPVKDLEVPDENYDEGVLSEKEELNGISSDSELEEGDAVANSYNALLQALNPSSHEGAPKKKKRKVEHDIESKNVASIAQDKKDEGIATTLDIDEAEEPEEQSGDDLEPIEDYGDLDKDEEAERDDTDPFQSHFSHPDESELKLKITAVSQKKWCIHKDKGEYRLKLSYPNVKSDHPFSLHSSIDNPQQLKLKPKLAEYASKHIKKFNAIQTAVATRMFNYQDLLFCARTFRSGQHIRQVAALHALNHILKTRDRVIKNNARASKEDTEDSTDLRDQGFTRPKVLVLLPTRDSCAKFVQCLTKISQAEQQENHKRFEDAYIVTEEKFSNDKPEDFRDLFAGNDDDMFRVGIKFTRKTIKFFAQFYNSDIILASPLGLRMAMGADDSKKQDYDFLSSIEICILDQADALLMQNWDHVEYIFEHLNLQPKEPHGCDFSRVRNWYLDNNAKYFRQTLVFSAFNTPDLNNIFLNFMDNVAGKAKIDEEYDGTILDLGFSIKQTFRRFNSVSPAEEPDARFNYFKTTIIPKLDRASRPTDDTAGGILLFIPSYLDFVRIRNYLASSSETQNISFGAISEYTSGHDVARARSHFLTGRYSVLLYTERAHHFRRYVIKGVKRVIMYSIPNNPTFYHEVAGFIGQTAGQGKVNIYETSVEGLFSKWDYLKLERIVGSSRVFSMLKDNGGDTFDFV